MSGNYDRGGGGQRHEKRPVILDLSKHVDKEVLVKLAGGRQIRGVLKGWDPLVNLVLDNVVEELRDPSDPYTLSGKERKLGLLVARGPSVMTICPTDGLDETENPYEAE
mmetsp:Transcript_6853/g.20840  ORF Transcript_6853/g.20840 Transcript_6853/m.20840 type:complete len:109 (-) Transcript_6853:571-897(-)|eukprot:CAMPEP_0198726832 /NCGR_PEP_ID=MMETSP1475-20131203/3758_1 /TAXON_ID= ORGANISM="Unidentified sp., Strain CCMP1999" /NCGR_SAMPLE_ID=MMETSP1475 /ASSEMBLY_ACC=CAM_ASM_001111 /LENGTH=108 /DNA_ID=CAMNT_0044488801 /DNA_START=216 /DNA_END=542 /DNA_ORIENTATION=-